MVSTTVNLSPNKYDGRSQPITFIAIHTMEAPETPETAENIAAWFAELSSQVSAHWCVDDNSRVRCVEDGDTAWTIGSGNPWCLNVEMSGYAAQSVADWKDDYSIATLDIVAQCCAEWAEKYNIPVRHLSDSQIAGYEKGFLGHVDYNRVFNAGSHTDPGSNFPWNYFLGRVVHFLSGPAPKVQTNPSKKPNCTGLQAAVRTKQDNRWGTITDDHCTALISASLYGGAKFPYGVKFAQGVVGAKEDGDWGPESRAALVTTTSRVQTALSKMGFNPQGVDGIWGPDTNSAYHAARAACHI